MKGLAIHGVSVRYGRREVPRELSAGPLPRGMITALLGPNGSGKSTLLRVLAGLTTPSAGRLTLDGETLALSARSARSHSVVYLPQALPAGVRLQVLESVLVARRATRDAASRRPATWRSRTRCWRGSGSARWRRVRSTSCRAASGNWSASRRRWCAIRRCCCSTSRCRRSTSTTSSM
nr:ABC transporter ATP-binding protein [Burkholderia gladioli]